jgi:group I intron endonuclease
MIVYKATNKLNGKVYVGQTRHSLDTRKRRHLHSARDGVVTHFYQAIRKYGEDNFSWEVICTTNNKKTLNELETYYINYYDSIHNGYNMVDGGDNNIMDIEQVKTHHAEVMASDEVRKKISVTMKKLRAEKGFSEETRKKISTSLKGNHNFGSGDTRSIACYCVDELGNEHHFHNYKQGGIWWYENYHPFPYSVSTYQKRINHCIRYGYCEYGRKPNRKRFDNLKWYREDGGKYEEVANKR